MPRYLVTETFTQRRVYLLNSLSLEEAEDGEGILIDEYFSDDGVPEIESVIMVDDEYSL